MLLFFILKVVKLGKCSTHRPFQKMRTMRSKSLFQKFAASCKPKHNVTLDRYRFNTRAQRDEEILDEFVTYLQRLTMLCIYSDQRGYEAPKTMAAQVRTNQVNQVIRHPRTTFGAVVVNVNKRSVSADARAFRSF